MELYTARGNESTDKISDEFLFVNNFGYIKNVDVDMHVLRKNGRLDYQIIYIEEGYGFFVLNNEYIKVESGNIVIIPPKVKNDYRYTSESKTDCYWIHFSGVGAENLIEKLRLTGPVLNTGNFYEFKDIFTKMSKASAGSDFITDSFLASSLYMLLSLISQKIYLNASPIHKVLSEMQNTKISEYKNETFAKKCNLSEYHFIREFKKLTGRTPHKYMSEITVSKAIDLLLKTNMNISETAYFLGFEDSLYFSRFFKKEIGVSPKQYVKNMK